MTEAWKTEHTSNPAQSGVQVNVFRIFLRCSGGWGLLIIMFYLLDGDDLMLV